MQCQVEPFNQQHFLSSKLVALLPSFCSFSPSLVAFFVAGHKFAKNISLFSTISINSMPNFFSRMTKSASQVSRLDEQILWACSRAYGVKPSLNRVYELICHTFRLEQLLHTTCEWLMWLLQWVFGLSFGAACSRACEHVGAYTQFYCLFRA